MNLFAAITGQREEERRAREYRDLIRKEAAIGGKLFGPIPKGGRREFFCLDRNTWVWHEEWVAQDGKRHTVMTRYDVRPQGIYKAQDGQPYRPLSFDEAKHFYKAIKLYDKAVSAEVYGGINYLNAIS
ncbi:MAG TPA: hypothetical protein VD735_07510 [Candidatus Saccharimonadales bacterium]|nr:hypothetical protein [Candidatus Saccharimonadales bacterium]